MKLLEPFQFADYELIDSGEQEKLERFGKIILSRPEPQAVWDKSLSRNDWDKSFNARFIRKKGNKEDNFEKGEWQIRKDCPQQWFINYKYKSLNLKFRLGLTSFGHIGIFPEQAANWNYIHDFIAQIKIPLRPKVLNLFAYTGIASMVAKKAGADVYHVDSVKQVINWANEIAIANNLQDIHWVVEDAMKFVKREVKRGNKYKGI
ncbi:MAG: oxidoreductase, partial [Bacteroidales bacterium]|nr:oxidoreductase [Bacteroidales bacterium]